LSSETKNTEYAFFEGDFVPIDNAKISIKTHALQYGTGVFEGIRAYWNEEHQDLYVFRMKEHFQRMKNSIKIMRIDCKYSTEELCSIVLKLLQMTKPKTDTYVRPLAYKASLRVGPGLQDNPSELCIFTTPFGAYFKVDEGLRVMVSSWRRVDDNAIPPRAKVSGSYANTALAKTDAICAGFDDAIVLDQTGHVSEGSAMNLFMVQDGHLVTSPGHGNILEGITRRTIMEFAKNEFGIETEIRTIDRSELYTAEEVFFCGTGAEIAPVLEIDKRTVGEGKTGEITRKIFDMYAQVTRGEIERYNHWVTPVFAESGKSSGKKLAVK